MRAKGTERSLARACARGMSRQEGLSSGIAHRGSCRPSVSSGVSSECVIAVEGTNEPSSLMPNPCIRAIGRVSGGRRAFPLPNQTSGPGARISQAEKGRFERAGITTAVLQDDRLTVRRLRKR
jgi:hypothetical protein